MSFGKTKPLGRPTIKEMETEYGGAGVFDYPRQERFLLENPDWKYDIQPEIMDGKNVIDYVDPDIEEKVAMLEAEEEELLKKIDLEMDEDEEVTFLTPLNMYL